MAMCASPFGGSVCGHDSGHTLDFVPISLHHAQVFYPPGEEAKARDFYGKRLGLREIERPSTLSERDGLWYEAPPGHVHLSADDDLGLHPRRHFALRVDDLDAMRNRLREGGARFEEATSIPGWRRCYVFDPFGNKIELDEIP
jgi:catechol 2,3-dioxygenase-like lactoylglutathione lyase family enzyme